MVDESLYSRQLYVLGHDAMLKLQTADVLISGMGGLGVEIAKNIILTGVKSVVLHDTRPADYTDLSSQFYLGEKDIGKNRALQSMRHLVELNPYVHVECHMEILTKSFLEQFKTVVLTDSNFDEQMEFAEHCHLNSINIIIAETRGLFGKIFCDFGENFEICDVDGKDRLNSEILSITNDAKAIVTTVEPHDFEYDDWVQFKNVDGMTQINGNEYQVKKLTPRTFSIGDTRLFNEYDSNGIAKFIRKPKFIDFKSFKEAHLNPNIITTDHTKINDQYTIHCAFEALHEFSSENNNEPVLPREWCLYDARKLIKLTEKIHQKRFANKQQLNESLLKLFSYTARGNLCPIQSIVGSLAAQEIIKASTGKYEPIQQFLYYDARECLPSLETKSNGNETSRYASQEIVFGKEFQQKLAKLNIFLVGCGALGCEYMKNFAMMGVCTSAGKLTVSDMDMIEKSNLNRQFLFRNSDINKPKSHVARDAIKKINSKMNVDAYCNQIGNKDTDSLDKDGFYRSLNLICSALDNIETRNYVDKKCVFYSIPIIESGTLGTEGKVQVILPYLTKSYRSNDDGGSSSGQKEQAIPACTLKLFPTKIQHTIQWSKDLFSQYFTLLPQILNKFASNPKTFIEKINDTNRDDAQMILSGCVQSYSDCLKWSLRRFYLNFNECIYSLTKQYPIDYVSTENGANIWNNQRNFPRVLKFNSENDLNLIFCKSAACLVAQMFEIPVVQDDDRIINEFVEASNYDKEPLSLDELKIKLNEKIDVLKELQILKTIDFDKDNELHMNFVYSCSNLRALNYSIDCVDRFKCKLIAGRIVPAMATTTSLIVGLNCIEIYKIVQKYENLNCFKNTYIDLACPSYGFESSTPQQPSILKYLNRQFTIWDYYELQNDEIMTLNDLLKYFLSYYSMEISSLAYESSILYYYKKVSADNLNLKITDLIELLTKKKLKYSTHVLELTATCVDTNGKLVQIPSIKYHIKIF